MLKQLPLFPKETFPTLLYAMLDSDLVKSAKSLLRGFFGETNDSVPDSKTLCPKRLDDSCSQIRTVDFTINQPIHLPSRFRPSRDTHLSNIVPRNRI